MRLHTLPNGYKLCLLRGWSGAIIQVINPSGTIVSNLTYDNDRQHKADVDYEALIALGETPAPTAVAA